MRTFTLAIIASIMLTITTHAGTTITYTYDQQHRLTSADYSEAQTDSHVAYQYDAANNLDLEVSITDDQYLKSFLLYFSLRTRSVDEWLSAGWFDRLLVFNRFLGSEMRWQCLEEG